MRLLVEEIRLLETRISQLEVELAQLARQSPACKTLLTVPGVGLLTATALDKARGSGLACASPDGAESERLAGRDVKAATSGDVTHFKDARHFASWFGLTPKESSSGTTRRLGRISKRGDRYLRMLLTHGARSVLRAATVADCSGKTIDPLRRWALTVQGRTNHNRATCALANKMARICYALLRDHQDYGAARVNRKLTRETYAQPA